MSAEEVANAFVQHYYSTFDTNRAALASLYQPVSTMSWEGMMLSGQQAILGRLQELPQVQHEYPTVDIQPSTSSNAMIIFVQGKIKIEENNPIHFTQVFQLVAHQPGQYYIHNDVFRLLAVSTTTAVLAVVLMSVSGPKSIPKNGSISPTRPTLMERQTLEKGDVSMLATLRISELDKLVAKMKQQKATCLAAVDHYEKEMAHIDREVKNIMDKYMPMCKRLEQRREERAQLQKQVSDVSKQFGDILATTKKQLRATTHEHVQHIRHEAASELSGTRGYSLGRESTVYQRTSALSPARK